MNILLLKGNNIIFDIQNFPNCEKFVEKDHHIMPIENHIITTGTHHFLTGGPDIEKPLMQEGLINITKNERLRPGPDHRPHKGDQVRLQYLVKWIPRNWRGDEMK